MTWMSQIPGVESQQQQLEVESKTNAELEDMLLRIEKHFKAEQAARPPWLE